MEMLLPDEMENEQLFHARRRNASETQDAVFFGLHKMSIKRASIRLLEGTGVLNNRFSTKRVFDCCSIC
jgi:hypothetical protein